MIFSTFKRNGIQFLLIPNGPNCNICDSDGNNYGTYQDLASFESFAERNGGFEAIRLGKVQVAFIIAP